MSWKTVIFGVILILVGLILLGNRLDLFYISARDFFQLFFPLGLMLLGFWLIIRRRHHDRRLHGTESGQAESLRPPPPPPGSPLAGDSPRSEAPPGNQRARVSEAPKSASAGKRRYSKGLGDMFIDCNGVDLQAVEVSAGIGDVEIKLHGGVLAPGLNRMVVSGFIGDIRILVPPDMPVAAQCSSFIGDMEIFGQRVSGFGNNIDGQTAGYDQAEAKLYIASNSFIGDLRVYMV